MKTFEDLLTFAREKCIHGEVVAEETMIPKGVRIHPSDLRNLCTALYEDPAVYFDMLSCITAIDNGPEAGTFELIYNLYSIPFNHHLAVKVVIKRDEPTIDSIHDIWRTANWHEREAFDLFGIRFGGHPDLRRILLPADWEGYPLRKDYKQQEYYRGVKVEF